MIGKLLNLCWTKQGAAGRSMLTIVVMVVDDALSGNFVITKLQKRSEDDWHPPYSIVKLIF